MAVERENPYGAFNYLVEIMDRSNFGDAGSIQAGFQEVSGLSKEVAIAEYRNGNEGVNHVRKIPLQPKYSDVTLKRGVIGHLEFYSWIKEIGDGNEAARSTVKISLRDETGQNTVMTWILYKAWPTKYTPPTFSAKGASDSAMEELNLAYEWFVTE